MSPDPVDYPALSALVPVRPPKVREPKRVCARCGRRVGHRPGRSCWLCYEPRRPRGAAR